MAPNSIRSVSSLLEEDAALRPVWQNSAQHACYDTLSLALQEGHVFAALTGPPGSGKTVLLDALLAGLAERSVRCIRISDPDKVSARLAAHIEQAACKEAGQHVLLAIDDAHVASDALLHCLTRIAAAREPWRRVPQVLLAGQEELWDRLALEEYQKLAHRLVVRSALPELDAADPWASVEQELTQATGEAAPGPALRGTGYGVPSIMSKASSPVDAAGIRPDYTRVQDAALSAEPSGPARPGLDSAYVPPPTLYALFPDAPPRSATPARQRPRSKRLIPLAAVALTAAGLMYGASWYAWPDFLADAPWAEAQNRPVAPPPNPQGNRPAPASGRPDLVFPAASAPQPPVLPVTAPSTIPAPTPATQPDPVRIALALTGERAMAPSIPAPVPPAPPRPAPAIVAPMAAVPPAIIALLLRRGDEQAALGDVSAARLLYQRAAEAGNGPAARLAAQTYDEALLPPAIASTLADRGAARTWYARAATLGDADAAKRLETLDGGR